MSILLRYLCHPASLAGLLRGVVVAGNLVVLLGLALVLGLDGFGALIVLWGLALVGSTLLGFGGPLTLLARLGDGAGMHPRAVLWLCLGLPLIAALTGSLWLAVIWPQVPWPAVAAMALAVNLAACLGSILRALGSVQISMVLRDGAPLLALGLAGLTRWDATAILWLATVLLGVICAVGAVLVWRHPARTDLIGQGKPGKVLTPNLWATAVLGMVLMQVDIIIGGQFLTAEQIGVYALVRRLANLVALPISVATWISAGPISAAHAAQDRAALQRASNTGAQIALLPGLGLAVCALPALWWLPPNAAPVLGVLLAGTIVQLAFAQGMTVATLTGHGHLAAVARLAGVIAYLGAVALAAPFDPLWNALAYAGATSLCAAILWLVLWRDTGVNTLALQTRARAWRMQ